MSPWFRSAHPWIWSAVVAFGLISAFFLFSEKPLYEAHAAVEAAPSSSEILSSDAIILQAARHCGLQADPEFNQPAGNAALVANVKRQLTVRNDGQLVQLAFTALDAVTAASFTNALLDAYNQELDSRGIAKAVEMTANLDALQAAIDEKETQLAATAPRLSQAAARALAEDASRQRKLYDAMLAHAAAAPRAAVRFADRAAIPAEPINSNPWAGLMFGIPVCLIGAGLFFVSKSKLETSAPPPARLDVMCSQAEIEKPVVAVSNAGTGFIHPDTLLDYVENLLGAGHSVLIIDCELGGALTASVGLRGEFGFTDFLLRSPVLRGHTPAWRTNREGVCVMPIGTRPNRIPVLLAEPGVSERMALLLTAFDRVVINAPPVLTAGEMRNLSPLVDGVILVAAHQRSLDLAHLAVQQVEEFGGRVIGLVEDPAELAAH